MLASTISGLSEHRLPDVAHLEDLRRSFVEGAPPLPEIIQRLLLDTLGIGNRQAFDFLAERRPDAERFSAWIAATAGIPDPVLLNRYHAAVCGTSLGPEAAADLQAVEEYPHVLDAEAIAHWKRHGYVIVRGAISGRQCETVAQQIWHYMEASADNPSTWYAHATEGIMVPVYQHAALDAARRSLRVRKAFAQLWGSPNLWSTIDQLGFNPPEVQGHTFRGSPPHWDVSLVQPVPFATQAVLYLTDTAKDQGAFRCIPGFHTRLEQWLGSLGDTDPRSVDLSNQAITVPGMAGDLVIWRQDLPHGASPNHADRPRLVQYLNFYPPDLAIAEEWR